MVLILFIRIKSPPLNFCSSKRDFGFEKELKIKMYEIIALDLLNDWTKL